MQPTLGGKPLTLREGEQIIWQGRPVQGIIRNPAHIASGALLAGLGLWALGGGFGLTPLLLLAIGAYLMLGHAVVEKNRRAGTYYALTNQRALLAYGIRVLAYPILPRSDIRLKKGRYDTVLLDTDHQIGKQPGANRQTIGFGHLENGEELYKLMRSIQKKGGMNGQDGGHAGT